MLRALPQPIVQWDPSLQTLGTTIAAIVTAFMVFLLVRKWLAIDEEDRRQQERCCPSCGYDLRATDDRCPECGMTFHRDESGAPYHCKRRFTGEVIVDSRQSTDPGAPNRVFATSRPMEAEFAKQALVSHGLTCVIEGEALVGGGARDGPLYLIVPASTAATARAILQELLNEDREAADHLVANSEP
jgi:hypothetical protein